MLKLSESLQQCDLGMLQVPTIVCIHFDLLLGITLYSDYKFLMK